MRKNFFTRKRISMAFSVFGVTLMGIDLMLTRNFFTHIGELMAASIFCLVIGLILDRQPCKPVETGRKHRKSEHRARL